MDEKSMRFPTKFRSFSAEHGWFSFAKIAHGLGIVEVSPEDGCELSACTEISDKNGRLIWTGDVLRPISKIENPEDGFWDVIVSDCPTEWTRFAWTDGYVVIGNKWEGVK